MLYLVSLLFLIVIGECVCVCVDMYICYLYLYNNAFHEQDEGGRLYWMSQDHACARGPSN